FGLRKALETVEDRQVVGAAARCCIVVRGERQMSEWPKCVFRTLVLKHDGPATQQAHRIRSEILAHSTIEANRLLKYTQPPIAKHKLSVLAVKIQAQQPTALPYLAATDHRGTCS